MAQNGVIAVNNRTINGIVVNDAKFIPVTLTFTAAETWPAGAVLGRLTATGAYVRYNPTLSTGAEVPSAVLTQPVAVSAAGNIPYQAMVEGEARLADLVINDGTAITAAQAFALRTYNIIARDVRDITFQDNQ